jgi:transcriptional regulator with GAF, ATPase, and Fis domain
MLENYAFPGNVRELENTIERSVVLAERDIIQKVDLELADMLLQNSDRQGDGYVPSSLEELKEMKRHIRGKAVETVEKAFVLSALQRNNWNVTRAAEETGILRPNFQGMLKKLGISVKDQIEH